MTKLEQGDFYGGQRRKGRTFSPVPNSKAKTDEGRETSSNTSGNREENSSDKRSKIPRRFKKCQTHHVEIGILPCVKTTSLRLDANLEESVSSDMLRLMRSPAKSQRKVVRNDQLHYWMSLHNWIVHPRFFFEKVYSSWKKENWDQNTPSDSPSAPGTKIKTRERQGPSRGIVQKCEPHERSLCAPKFGKDHMRTPSTKKDALAEEHGIWRTWIQAQECGQNNVLLSYWSTGNAGTHFEKYWGARIRCRFRSINAHD